MISEVNVLFDYGFWTMVFVMFIAIGWQLNNLFRVIQEGKELDRRLEFERFYNEVTRK